MENCISLSGHTCVQVLAGVQLIFFTVACIGKVALSGVQLLSGKSSALHYNSQSDIQPY